MAVYRVAPARQAPHQHIPVSTGRERFTLRLFDDLWARYRRRVSYVRAYESVVRAHGGRFVNDHIAFRTIAWQNPGAGIATISRIFQALGYVPKACYEFPDKQLSSIHLQHPNAQFPKLFISELKTWELTDRSRRILKTALGRQRHPVSDDLLSAIRALDSRAQIGPRLLAALIQFFGELPWRIPRKREVQTLNEETQFGAWVLLNGYDVNHFTASVNSHGVASLGDIEKTVAALKRAGVPMKRDIEGAPGSVLRQSSTESVVLPFRVRGRAGVEVLDWSYAYFELAERGSMRNPRTGRRERFEGFLGAQATHLFEMTKLKK